MKKPTLLGVPQEINRVGNLDTIRSVDFAKIPTYYYDWNRFELPLTDAEFDAEFGSSRVVFNLEDDSPCNRQTNTAIGSSINEPFLALGVGVVAIGESEGFSVYGARIDRPAAEQATPRITYVAGCGGDGCGLIDTTFIPAGQNPRPANFWWGAPTWRFIEKFFQAYRLQVLLNHRFQVTDESLLNVGMAPLPSEFSGASDSRIPATPFVRATNNVLAAKGINHLFLPGNSGTGGDDTPVSLSALNVAVTYGHPRICGLANRMYPFVQPLLFTPGMQFEISFQRVEDESCYRALRSSSTVTTQTADALTTAVITGVDDTGGAPAIIPGGSISLGLVLKGYALWPQACVDYLSSCLLPGSKSAAMYGGNEYLMGLVREHGGSQGGRLAGLLEGKG